MGYEIVRRSVDTVVDDTIYKAVYDLKRAVTSKEVRGIERSLNSCFSNETESHHISVFDVDNDLSLLSCYTFLSEDDFLMYGVEIIKNARNESVSIFEQYASAIYNKCMQLGYRTLNIYFISNGGGNIKNVVCSSDERILNCMNDTEAVLHYGIQCRLGV